MADWSIALIDTDSDDPMAMAVEAGIPSEPPGNARSVASINWADSGPGIDWPEWYWLSWDEDRSTWILWQQTDSEESAYGVSPPILPVAWCSGIGSDVEAAGALLEAWWRNAVATGQDRFQSLEDTSLLTEREVHAIASRVWPEADWSDLEDEVELEESEAEPVGRGTETFGWLTMSRLRGDLGPIVEALSHEDASRRLEAVDALSAFEPEDAHEGALKALSDAHPGVRTRAASLLARSPTPTAVASLLDRLAADDSPEVRRACAAALGQIADAVAADGLVEALSDEAPSVRAAAVVALARAGGASAIAPLSDLLEDVEEETAVRESALDALTKLGATEVPQLSRALGDESPGVRLAAARSLLEWFISTFTGALGSLLNEPGGMVSHDAIEVLRWAPGQFEDSVVTLFERALEDDSQIIRWTSAEGLGEFGSGLSIESLTKALADAEPLVRMHAADGLGRLIERGIGPRSMIEPLLGRVPDPDPGVRRATARALGEAVLSWLPRETVQAISAAMDSLRDDPDPGVRKAAEETGRRARMAADR